MADNNRVVWTYTDDNAAAWAVSAKAVYVLGAEAAKYGGSAPAATVASIKKQIKMRRVKCSSAGHPDIWVVVYAVGATLWTTPGTTIIRDLNGVDVTYVATRGKRAETNRDGIRQTA
jgi:hypothetical protein